MGQIPQKILAEWTEYQFTTQLFLDNNFVLDGFCDLELFSAF